MKRFVTYVLQSPSYHKKIVFTRLRLKSKLFKYRRFLSYPGFQTSLPL